ncbi:uncharacterized protein F4822DRAFT_123268 [Hypoxylon trugodes]|uniref:uncharacterized protein n=1 Tax=Hypoxylon trugodes TaxID=326681 RepID=UPI00219485F8|nr:uncharacterized protein F4822DRAFT_123268 [Hypoxylon trugodes]KAI1392283.1 hypothetical protein F4822DRAFT_123268 [Hypoxylon trugodes]
MEAATTSFALRRPAADTLPPFQLPIRGLDVQVPSMADFPYNPVHTPPSRTSSPIALGYNSNKAPCTQYDQRRQSYNSLTSSTGVTGSQSISPLSSSVNSGSSRTSQPGQQAVTAYTQDSWYTPPVSVASPYSSSPVNQGLMQPNYNRTSYPPVGSTYPRSSQPSTTAEGLTATSAYDSGSSSFPLPVSGGGVGPPTILSPPSHQHQPPLRTSIMSSSHGQGSQPHTPSTTGPSDPYARSQTSSSYYHQPPPPSTQSSFSSFTSTHNSPPLTSPTTGGGLSRGISSLSPHHHQHSPIQAPHYSHPPYPYRPHPPALAGAVLTNMQNPGGQVALVGGMNHIPPQYHHSGSLLGSMYHPHGAANSQQDRPFKCDECPISFNRNHDLKRHKRIHLAIKPFPCTFCDKSFSRKDALKRHRLVKGCGTGKSSPNGGNRNTPPEDSRRGSDGPSSSALGIKEEPM